MAMHGRITHRHASPHLLSAADLETEYTPHSPSPSRAHKTSIGTTNAMGSCIMTRPVTTSLVWASCSVRRNERLTTCKKNERVWVDRVLSLISNSQNASALGCMD